MMKRQGLAGGILCEQSSPSGGCRYYLIRSLLPREEELCYSLFCTDGQGAAFFFDVCRQEERARELMRLLCEGEVGSAVLEEVLEEL